METCNGERERGREKREQARERDMSFFAKSVPMTSRRIGVVYGTEKRDGEGEGV